MRWNIKAFIIHLQRARSRKRQVDALCHYLPVPAEVIAAVDGEQLQENDIKAVYRRKLYRPAYPFRLTTSEIACFLSHRKVWQAIVDQKLDAGLVMEDDVALTQDFDAAFSLACKELTKKSFFRFPWRMREKGAVIAENGPVRLIRPKPTGLGTTAQLVGYDAAKKLLAATRHFDRPIDTMMQLFWVTGVRPFSLIPGGVMEISEVLGGSTLQKQRRFKEKLHREIARPLYRMQIAALSYTRAHTGEEMAD